MVKYLNLRVPHPLSLPHTSASATSHSTDSTISSRQAHSRGEWGLWSPQERLGVGRPSSVSREPSVPPRTIVRLAVRPSRSQGLFGIGHGPRLGDKPFGHVAILAFDGHVDFRRRELPHRGGGRLTDAVGQPFELRGVEIAEQNLDLHLGHAAGNVVGVQEALAAVGRFGREDVARQPGDEIGRPRGWR